MLIATLLLAAPVPQTFATGSELDLIETLTPSVSVHQFGTLVAMDEEENRVAIGSFPAAAESDDWRVFLFAKTPAGWVEQAMVAPPFPLPGFPQSLALRANRFVLAAGDSSDIRLFVYEEAAGVWSSSAILSPANGNPSGSFGDVVALSGDRIMTGAYRDDTFGTNAGAVHVFAADASQPSGWLEEPLLGLPPGLDTLFGSVLAASDTRMVVGSMNGAHLFDRASAGSASWIYAAPLPILGASLSGSGVAVADDVAAVGDIELSYDHPFKYGAAHIYEQDAGGAGAWGSTATAVPFGPSVLFGQEVDINGTHMVVLDPVSSQIGPQLLLFKRVVKPGPDSWKRTGYVRDGCHPPARVQLSGSTVLAGIPTFGLDQGAVFVYRLVDLSVLP